MEKDIKNVLAGLGMMVCLLDLNSCSSRPDQEEKLVTHPEQLEAVSEEKKPVGDKEMYMAKAQEYVEAEQYDKAVNELQNALQLDPEDASIYYTLGNLYEQMGKDKESVESFIKAIQLDPEQKEVAPPADVAPPAEVAPQKGASGLEQKK